MGNHQQLPQGNPNFCGMEVWDWGFQGKEVVQYLLEQIGISSQVHFHGYKNSKPPFFLVCDSNLGSSAAGELQLFPKAESK